jgi:rhodanese-related sulfurtransferase
MFSFFRSTAGAPVAQVTPEEAAADTKRFARIVDVRQPEEFRAELGHIAGAELVPLATLAGAAASWDREQPILVVCRSGGRSSSGAATLVGMGFTRISNLAGGMLAWNARSLPVAR